MPPPIFDEFTGTPADPLDSPWRNDDVLDASRLIYVSGGGVEMETPGSDTFYVYDDTFDDDQYAEAEVGWNSTSGVYVGVLIRVTGVGATFAGYWYYNDGASTEQVLRYNGDGTQDVLWTGAHPSFVVGDTFRLSALADEISWYKNDLLIDSVTDADLTSGVVGLTAIGSGGTWRVVSFGADDAVALDPLVHVVAGRGNFAVDSPAFLSTEWEPGAYVASFGAAEPANWYHVGMISWGTANGAMTAYPVTRELDLVQLPAGMTTVWYEFAPGVTATITELAAP